MIVMFALQISLGRQDENAPNVYFNKRPTDCLTRTKGKTNERKEGELWGMSSISFSRDVGHNIPTP